MKIKNNAMLKKRSLSEDFLKSLMSGELKGLVDTIKSDNTLCLCFRGEYISVYYKGDSLFKIQKNKRSYSITFDFNHARYTANHQGQRKVLEGLDFKYSENTTDPKKERRRVTYNYLHNTRVDKSFWQKSSKILKSLVDDFLDIKKSYDWFKSCETKNKSCHLERQRQQEIMIANGSLADKYFVYDMECDQPRSSLEDKKSGRFDMLALRRTGKGCFNLVFIELKSTHQACVGKCGIEEHYTDLKRYIKNKALVEVRKREAYEICCQYGQLGLIKPAKTTIEGVELLFVFTDIAKNDAYRISDPLEKCCLFLEKLKLNEGYCESHNP